MNRVVLIAGIAALLAACSEKPQTLTSGSRPDTAAAQGTGVAAFHAGNWKDGDKASWEQQLKVRAQGQNDYARVN